MFDDPQEEDGDQSQVNKALQGILCIDDNKDRAE